MSNGSLTKQLASCALSDLAGVEICIGEICKAHFGGNSIVEGYWQGQGDEATYADDWECLTFYFGETGQCWFSMKVGPFLSKENFLS
jgi:hypothetical protein